MDKPLFSFCILTYNQVNTVEESIASALAQTYSPLEIIISDDCSSDETWEIINRTVSNYHGPHSIVLNRNEKNMGIAAHCSKVFRQLSRGEWIIGAAGDDVYMPNRCDDIYDAWKKTNFTATVAINGVTTLDTHSGVITQNHNADRFFTIKDFIHSCAFAGAGCASAYHRSVFNKFPPLATQSLEDRPLHFRGLLCGGIIYTQKIGVLYRITGNNVSISADPLKNKRKRHVFTLESTAQHYLDLAYALSENMISESEFISLCQAIQKMYKRQMSRNLIIHIPLSQRIKFLFSSLLSFESWCINLLAIILPECMYNLLKRIKSKIHSNR